MPQAENFYVAVRVRPLNKKEYQQKASAVIYIDSSYVLRFDPAYNSVKTAQQRPSKNIYFYFDRIYDEISTNNEIFEHSVRPMVQTFMTGVNCAIFAYGATASGKTYTVFGTYYDGLIFYLVSEVFDYISSEDAVEQQFIEIYNEQIRDLLSPEQTSLYLREDPIQGCFVPGLTTQQATSKAQAYANITHAFAQRQTNATDENAASSRSHAIMFLTLKRGALVAKFAVTDLAGSERLKRTNAVGVRALEGGNINKSLLALGNCLQALCKANSYVPYRNSKLTRLLKDSLSGNARVCMVANVSPAATSYDDTLNTLCYAQRASFIKTQAKVNIVAFYYTTAELTQMIQQYKEENAILQNELREMRATTTQTTAAPAQAVQQLQTIKADVFAVLQQILQLAKQYYQLQADRKYYEFLHTYQGQSAIGYQEVQLKSQIAQLKQKVLETQQTQAFKGLPAWAQESLKLLVENGQSCLSYIAQECYISFLERKNLVCAERNQKLCGYIELAKTAFGDLVMVTEVCGVSADELRNAKAKFERAFQDKPDGAGYGAQQQSRDDSQGDITLNYLSTERPSTLTFNLSQSLTGTSLAPAAADLRRAQNLRSFKARRVPGLARPGEHRYEEQLGELEKQLSAIGGSRQSRSRADQ